MTDNDVRRIEDKVDGLAIAFARLEGSLAPTLKDLTDGQSDIQKTVSDHEKRLRAMERFRFSVPSVSLVSLGVSLVLLFYYLHH